MFQRPPLDRRGADIHPSSFPSQSLPLPSSFRRFVRDASPLVGIVQIVGIAPPEPSPLSRHSHSLHSLRGTYETGVDHPRLLVQSRHSPFALVGIVGITKGRKIAPNHHGGAFSNEWPSPFSTSIYDIFGGPLDSPLKASRTLSSVASVRRRRRRRGSVNGREKVVDEEPFSQPSKAMNPVRLTRGICGSKSP